MYNKSGSWANASVVAQLQEIADLSFYYLFNSTEVNRLIGGPIISDIMTDIQNHIYNKSYNYKAKVYSGVYELFSFFLIFVYFYVSA